MLRPLLLALLFLPATACFAKPPNIVYVMLDDAGYGDFSPYGSRHLHTPTMERMCREGMKFTDHYSGSAVCAPTRCVLMTGLDPGHCRRRDNTATGGQRRLIAKNGRPLVFLEPEDVTVAEALKAAGYATAGVGKWGLGNPGSTGVPELQGFDHWFGYYDQVHAHDHFPPYVIKDGERLELPDNAGDAEQAYVPYLLEEAALDFIRESADEPFFLYFAQTLPHGHYEIPASDPAAKRYADKPWNERVRNYAAMVTRADETVGKILDLLAELNLDEDTIVFYTSDNGPNPPFVGPLDSSGGLRGVKRSLYEGGVRAPMVVRWPGHVPAGGVSDFVWTMADVFPTACELAGADTPDGLNGVSVLPTLLGRTQPPVEHRYFEIHHPFQQSVRRGDWKAIRFGVDEPIELYNLRDDPGETEDIAAAHPEVAADLTRRLDNGRTESPYFPAVRNAKQRRKPS